MQRRIVAIILLILVVSAPIAALAAKPQSSDENHSDSSRRVVFILMDNVSWDDIIAANDPILNRIISNSSIGVMNNRAFKAPSRPRNALGVGASGRASGDPSSFEAYNADEPYGNGVAMDTYKLRMGKRAKKGQVVELGIAAITKDNTTDMQEFYPGKLGDAIEAAGKKTAAFGNSDTSLDYESPYSLNREIALVAMNGHGVVGMGDVGKGVLKSDPNYPFGIKTDYKKLLSLFKEALGNAEFVAVDLGDTVRADSHSKYTFEMRALNYKVRAIQEGARFIDEAMKISGSDTTFIITALSPPGSSKASLRSSMEQLTPIIVSGPAFKAGGLTSDSTHRQGLVTIIDVAPTVLSALGIPKDPAMAGSELKTSPADVTPESLASFNRSAVGVKDTRRTAVLAYIYIQIALYIFAAVMLVNRKILNRVSVRVLETLIFTTMIFPLVSFYTTKAEVLATQKLLATLLTIVVSLIFAAFLVVIRKKALQPVLGIAVITVAILSIEVLAGGHAFLNTIFGYDPIRGARFFGIGNEAMAILMANGLLLFGIMLEKAWNRWTIIAGAILALVLIVLIGFPGLGTNTDGPIMATAAFTVMVLLSMKSKARLRNFAIAVAAVVAVLALFAGYDATHGATTHMGRSVQLIADGGLPQMMMIIKRKLATNIQIFRFSTWSYFLFITLGLLAFLWTKPAGMLRGLLERYRGISVAISASIVGGIVGFAFNDSGILIPAIIMSYMVPTVIYLMLWEQNYAAE